MKRGDVCYGMLRAAAVDESDHHALPGRGRRHGSTGPTALLWTLEGELPLLFVSAHFRDKI